MASQTESTSVEIKDLEKKQLRLKEKFIDIDNIKIFNHIEFQHYLLLL